MLFVIGETEAETDAMVIVS